MNRLPTVVSNISWTVCYPIFHMETAWTHILITCVRLYKYSIRICTSRCISVATIRIFSSHIVGFCWTSNGNWFTTTFSPYGKPYGQRKMHAQNTFPCSLLLLSLKPIVTLLSTMTWTLLILLNFSTVSIYYWLFSSTLAIVLIMGSLFSCKEMAEKHNTKCILKLARDLVKQLQILITNKDEYYD